MKEWELHSQWVNDLPESIETIKQPSILCGSVSLRGSLPVPPLVLGFGQIDPTQQQRKLFVTQDDFALSIAGFRPGETPFLQPLVTQSRMQMLLSHQRALYASRIRSIRSADGS
jgi:hypothetical protein